MEGEVFPCAGSYRSGVTIRLLKVGSLSLDSKRMVAIGQGRGSYH